MYLDVHHYRRSELALATHPTEPERTLPRGRLTAFAGRVPAWLVLDRSGGAGTRVPDRYAANSRPRELTGKAGNRSMATFGHFPAGPGPRATAALEQIGRAVIASGLRTDARKIGRPKHGHRAVHRIPTSPRLGGGWSLRHGRREPRAQPCGVAVPDQEVAAPLALRRHRPAACGKLLRVKATAPGAVAHRPAAHPGRTLRRDGSSHPPAEHRRY
jgi:hypothetical protein